MKVGEGKLMQDGKKGEETKVLKHLRFDVNLKKKKNS